MERICISPVARQFDGWACDNPLFRWRDKFGILLEPFRTKGTNPDETVGALTIRRLGRSYLDYAVDPFLSGVYAGDPMRLVTRYAMPKLYNLEQNYGSFIRGAFAKAKQPKSDRDKLANQEGLFCERWIRSFDRGNGSCFGQ